MTRLLTVLVLVLLAADGLTLSAFSRRRTEGPPDLTPRVKQLETDLAQAQQDIGELKQEVALLARHGQPDE